MSQKQPQPVTLDEQIACVEREIALRKKTYPRWVFAKRLTQETADREQLVMREVLKTLKGLKGEANAGKR